MQVLQGMDPDRMIIILPSALVAMYLIITLQKHLCTRQSRYPGLILPVLCFIASTVLALRPLLVDSGSEQEGLAVFCLRMWLTFNISTILFGFQYIRERRQMKALKEALEQQTAEAATQANAAADNAGAASAPDNSGTTTATSTQDAD